MVAFLAVLMINPFQGEKASADCGHEYRQFEPNVDDNVVVGEVFKKYVDT